MLESAQWGIEGDNNRVIRIVWFVDFEEEIEKASMQIGDTEEESVLLNRPWEGGVL